MCEHLNNQHSFVVLLRAQPHDMKTNLLEQVNEGG
jgi:hypothetical protein